MSRQLVEVDGPHLIMDLIGAPFDRELVPDLLPRRHFAVRTVRAEERDAAQDERRNGGVELHAGGESDRARDTPDLHR